MIRAVHPGSTHSILVALSRSSVNKQVKPFEKVWLLQKLVEVKKKTQLTMDHIREVMSLAGAELRVSRLAVAFQQSDTHTAPPIRFFSFFCSLLFTHELFGSCFCYPKYQSSVNYSLVVDYEERLLNFGRSCLHPRFVWVIGL